MSLRHPLAIARGLGSAKDGVGHWWVQRLTAVALLLLAPWFAWLVLGLIGADHYSVRHTLAQPLNASLLLAFVLSLFWHAQLGLQVVVEDYVHGWLEITLQIAVKFACAFGALASVIAIGRIAFTA
ncbi:MAG: succinate dehydrogenase, hydrophobic membrane anchor protein [Gammaproteobacteria bacterium RIFCSPHIGHO2_12_FULL_63_22]|nr:MAG: succinate dehydrogenase, hydrophobic membrane anchor protein [Gammaproteobacteria bacterium RIFCSPHIGHO2_12_FULL_63_22]